MIKNTVQFVIKHADDGDVTLPKIRLLILTTREEREKTSGTKPFMQPGKPTR